MGNRNRNQLDLHASHPRASSLSRSKRFASSNKAAQRRPSYALSASERSDGTHRRAVYSIGGYRVSRRAKKSVVCSGRQDLNLRPPALNELPQGRCDRIRLELVGIQILSPGPVGRDLHGVLGVCHRFYEGVDPKSGKTLASNAFLGRFFEALNRLRIGR